MDRSNINIHESLEKRIFEAIRISDIVSYKRKRKSVLKYAKRVSGRPFEREKELEFKEIWEAINKGQLCDSFADEVNYIKRVNDLVLYPYDFCGNYKVTEAEVCSDVTANLAYVIYKGKKLYFPEEEHSIIASKYRQLLMEQDPESPHRYLEDFAFECDVFVDVGSAEGIISLEMIDNAKEVYLLECSNEWVRALEYTFKPFQEKVHIIKKYASAYNDEYNITLDSLLGSYNDKKIIIKMDIEGMELDALRGAKNVMKCNDCILSCTTYHNDGDYRNIERFMKENDYQTSSTPNYMLFIHGNMTLANGKYSRMGFPYFRKGIIRAKKAFI